MPKVYDYKDLVMAYIDANRRGYLHEDFKTYFQSRLPKLEEAFDIYFKDAKKSLMMYFFSIVRSYNSIDYPGMMEMGGVFSALSRAGNRGREVEKLQIDVFHKLEEARNMLLEMMYALFIVMFGETDKTVTSEDLLKLGFDESKEPKERDYWDQM